MVWFLSAYQVLVATEVKTPPGLDIYLQRHSPLSPDLWLHYSESRLSFGQRDDSPRGLTPYLSIWSERAPNYLAYVSTLTQSPY